eukprot:SM000152S01565  [mRNA]  locus=s152:275605:280036:- [translate_table: standard]
MAAFWYIASTFFGKKAPRDPALLAHNLFAPDERLDVWVYVSEDPAFADLGSEEALVWYESSLPYASHKPGNERTSQYSYKPSHAVQHNGTVYAHIFVARTGYSPDPNDPTYDSSATFNASHPLVVYAKRPKLDKRKNLLGAAVNEESAKNLLNDKDKIIGKEVEGANEGTDVIEKDGDEEDDNEPQEWIAYWKPNMTIALIEDFTYYPKNQVPDPIRQCILIHPFILNFGTLTLVPKVMRFDEVGNYYPTVFVSDFWLLRDKWIPVNETVDQLPLTMWLGSMGLWKWQIYVQMEQSFKIQASFGSMVEGESDEIKRVFLEGNPVLLAITVVVSIFHSVFDFLAFKNDIQFWNSNKSMEGLSARSVVMNFVCQLIIFLYLLDNETSWMILISSACGCAIEFWKIGKAMHVTIDRSGQFPVLRFKDRESYAKNQTKEYDAQASKYLAYALYPLVIAYGIYSLMYQSHKSWYSWILSSLTGCVYTFGFIMMCPQLFINYKLKSVAHLPWRQMTYKFLNTIIDDLFAFVIKMPLLHRLSVFRDDIIFLIYLYQRWIYPVDQKRVNEFGFGGKEADTPEAHLAGPPPNAAVAGLAGAIEGEGAGGDAQAGITEGSLSRTVAGARSRADSSNIVTDRPEAEAKVQQPGGKKLL